jgi:ABC-2 type transport system permease protein
VKEFLILLKRELKSITKEKTIMFAILIQFFIASFSSIIMVGIMAFYDPSSISQNTKAHITLGLVENKPGAMDGFLQNPPRGIRVRHFTTTDLAENAFNSGKIDAIMVLPENQTGTVDMKLILPQLDTKQTVIMMMLQEPLKNYENYLRGQNGVKMQYANIPDKPSNTYEFLFSLIIPILMLFPALIAGSIMIDTITEEFENKTFDTLMTTPISLQQVFAAKIAAAVVTAIFQVILWTGLLRLNGMVIQNPVMVIAIAIMVAMLISFIAALVALCLKDRERAQFIYSIILVAAVAGSSFLGFSPVNLITVVASGVPNINLTGIGFYLALLAISGVLFFKLSRRLIFTRQ